jgi:predicted RNase H-like HicB family nuclease
MKVKFTYWQEKDGRFLGYLNDYPDHWTQGDSLEDLMEHLADLHETFSSESIPGIRKVGELEVV